MDAESVEYPMDSFSENHGVHRAGQHGPFTVEDEKQEGVGESDKYGQEGLKAVSYTHLTLPTILRV